MIIKLLKMAGIIGILLHTIAQPVYAADKQRPVRDEKSQQLPET